MSGWRWDVLILAMGWLNGVMLGWLLWHRPRGVSNPIKQTFYGPSAPVWCDECGEFAQGEHGHAYWQLTERDPNMRIVE
jgi:hypothetical protein